MTKRLSKDKRYQVTKFYLDETKANENMGVWNGQDVRLIIGNAKYDDMFGMYFPASVRIKYGFEIEEVR